MLATSRLRLSPSSSTLRLFSSWDWATNKTSASTDAALSSSSSSSSSLSSSSPSLSQIDPQIQKTVLSTCAKLHASVMPLNSSLAGPLEQNSDKTTALPFVLLVGNHSSGKSSFINHVLGRRIQTAGVAPTDDCFTVIAPGAADIDQDGEFVHNKRTKRTLGASCFVPFSFSFSFSSLTLTHPPSTPSTLLLFPPLSIAAGPALIGDPDMGFSNLRHFGPSLIHHTQLKIRSSINAESFMMIDSPGMIDSPVTASTTHLDSISRNTVMDRGYDFEGVVRWFAERADVILLFFDPDKPGTTGETLSILVNSLGGMDHKLLIVMNKADQFKKIHDFARAYGSLCWNLSKVIPRKDLPRIYTMCLPVADSQVAKGALGSGLQDLYETRNDVVAEVRGGLEEWRSGGVERSEEGRARKGMGEERWLAVLSWTF